MPLSCSWHSLLHKLFGHQDVRTDARAAMSVLWFSCLPLGAAVTSLHNLHTWHLRVASCSECGECGETEVAHVTGVYIA
jgi:hypothetical protein